LFYNILRSQEGMEQWKGFLQKSEGKTGNEKFELPNASILYRKLKYSLKLKHSIYSGTFANS
jgi:hypothetical protein